MTTAVTAKAPAPAASQDDRGLLAREVVRVYKAFLGRGPTRAAVERVAPDQLECRLGDVLTTCERVLVESGHADLVTEVRDVLHGAMRPALAAAAQRATGRRVTKLELRFDAAGDAAVECFTLAVDA